LAIIISRGIQKTQDVYNIRGG